MTLLEAAQHTLVFQRLLDENAAKLAKSTDAKQRWCAQNAVDAISWLAEQAKVYNQLHQDDVISVEDMVEVFKRSVALLQKHRG